MPQIAIVHVPSEAAAESLTDQLHIPVIAEIEPRPDPVYGHTFKWPFDDIVHFFEARPSAPLSPRPLGEGQGEGGTHA